MRAALVASALLWLPLAVSAKPRHVISGASARPAASSLPHQECMQFAINGRFEGECAADHESDQCVGLSLALRNSLKREDCRVRAGEGCLEYTYHQNSQAQWMAVASGFLAEFGQCVRNQYGAEGSNGFKEALADPSFRSKLHEFDDGASAMGLRNGEIIERLLQEESLSSILRTAPNWQVLEPRLRERMLVAADTPVPVQDSGEIVKAAGEGAFAHPRNGAGWNRAGGRGAETAAGGVAPRALGTARPVAKTEWNVNTSGIEEIARAPASVRDDVFVRNIKANPYSLGLDLSLFDRVSLTYQKRIEGLRGINDYVKSLPKREPKTVRDLLERNKEMEL